MGVRNLVHWLFNPLVIAGSVLVAAVLLIATLALLWYTRPGPTPSGPATAVLNVIALPTETLVPSTPTPVPGPTPTLAVPPSPAEGVIGVGAFVQINGTGGDGLRLRADPSLEGEVRFLALEAEVFQIQDGPQEAAGYTWWFLVAPYDEKVRGWAVSNFLTVVQNP